MRNLNTNVVKVVASLMVAAFIGLSIYSIVSSRQELKNISSEAAKLEVGNKQLKADLTKIKLDNSASKEKIQELEKKVQESDKQLQEKESQLQAKLEAKRKLAQGLSSGTTASASSGSCQDYMIAAGISDMANANILIGRESGCNPCIINGGAVDCNYSGDRAYGIPQSLPGNKMASHGADWKTNPVTQLRWMQDYVIGRYGSWAGAVAHSHSVGWY